MQTHTYANTNEVDAAHPHLPVHNLRPREERAALTGGHVYQGLGLLGHDDGVGQEGMVRQGHRTEMKVSQLNTVLTSLESVTALGVGCQVAQPEKEWQLESELFAGAGPKETC